MLKSIVKTVLSVLVLALLIAAGSFAISSYVKKIYPASILTDNISSVKQDNKNQIFIIDAGHGGEDPGAIGVGGIEEKNINLTLSKKIQKLLEFDGYDVIMTRETDILLYDSESAGSRKAQDLRNRLDFEKKYPDAVFVSIHMNKFPQESCHGLQVYYSGNNEQSMVMAEAVRDGVKATVQPDNRREIKKADSSIFILNNISIPAVLIECGFISNNAESALLSDDGYLNKLAAVLANSLAESVNYAENE